MIAGPELQPQVGTEPLTPEIRLGGFGFRVAIEGRMRCRIDFYREPPGHPV